MKRPALLALLLVPLLLLPLVAHVVAEPPAAAFQPPPFRLGDVATYAVSSAGGAGEPWSVRVDRIETTLDRSARSVDAVVLAFDVGRYAYEQRVSIATMTVENLWASCATSTESGCSDEFTLSWFEQGSPGALGATLLQGRSFAVGDAWTLAGDCAGCEGPITVAIEPPAPDSPPGTAFVARTSAAPFQSGRLHMGTDAPFPLLAQLTSWGGAWNATLASFTPGSGDVVRPPTPPESARSPPPLAEVPYEGRRPVEGSPLTGFPSWADARAATGPDPADDDASATLLSLAYPAGAGASWLDPAGVEVLRQESFDVASVYARAGRDDVETTYSRGTLRVAGLPIGAASTWSASSRTLPPTTLGACRDSSVPLWDLVRHAQGTGLLGGFAGFWLDRRGPQEMPACDHESFVVLGGDGLTPRAGAPPEMQETLQLDPHTGHLEYAFLRPHD